MGTTERRLEIMKYLCLKRHTTLRELSERFGVSQRTIQRDIYEIETVFCVPIDIKYGKHDGGIHVVGDYSPYRMFMSAQELEVLNKVKTLVEGQLSKSEKELFEEIIKNHTKSA